MISFLSNLDFYNYREKWGDWGKERYRMKKVIRQWRLKTIAWAIRQLVIRLKRK